MREGDLFPPPGFLQGGPNQRCPLRLPRENRTSPSFMLGNAAEGDATPTPPRIRPDLHPADLTPLSCRRRRQAEAEAHGEAGDGGSEWREA